MNSIFRSVCVLVLIAGLISTGRASSILEVTPLTGQIILVHFKDGHVVHSVAGQAYGEEKVVNAPLDTAAAVLGSNYRVTSTNDPRFAIPLQAADVGRKSKGTDFAWQSPPNWTLEHWLYLQLPSPMKTGSTYVLDTGSLADNGNRWTLTFDERTARSEAVHVNLVGHVPGAPQKFAYVYHWMGDRGGLDLKPYQGKMFHLVDKKTGASAFSGPLRFRFSKTTVETAHPYDSPNGNFLGSDVYDCDFSAFSIPGTYVVSVEGIGCSFPFKVEPDIYREAFFTVVRGLYHNRSGIELTTNHTRWPRPAPHNPRLTPGFANKLFYTTNRFTEWGSEGGTASQLTNRTAFRGFVESAGWYQDAGDWDGYYSHLIVPQQLLFAYEVAPRNFRDGELNLPEGVNGVPDILDEAGWLPRFFYRLRHELMQKGYCDGGIGSRIAGDAFGSDTGGFVRGSWQDTNRLWAVSGADPWSTYRYAGVCAHLAYCLNLARAPDPEGVDWVREGQEAYTWAAAHTASGDENHPQAPTALKNPRAYAAAALFRVTGKPEFQEQFLKDFPKLGSGVALEPGEPSYAVMVYALGTETTNSYNLQHLKAARTSLLEATDQILLGTASKRACRWGGNFYFPMLVGQQTAPNVIEGIVGLAVARRLGLSDVAGRYLGALYTTADYFLGCNSLNMTWVTGLGPRHPNQIFHIDSWVVGYHDGMIPYGPWRTESSNPGGASNWVTDHDYANRTCYPPIGGSQSPVWPGNERWHDNRWSPMSSEFTISQTLSPTAALFGVLCDPGFPASNGSQGGPQK